MRFVLGESWNSKNIRNELLNKKEERDGRMIGKVKRYRPGVVVFGCLYQSEVPDFAKQKEEKEQERKKRRRIGDGIGSV